MSENPLTLKTNGKGTAKAYLDKTNDTCQIIFIVLRELSGESDLEASSVEYTLLTSYVIVNVSDSSA